MSSNSETSSSAKDLIGSIKVNSADLEHSSEEIAAEFKRSLEESANQL